MDLNISSLLCYALLSFVFLASLPACSSDDHISAGTSAATHEFEGEEARVWMDLISNRIQAEGYSPPVASRVLAYSGVTIYEAVVRGMEKFQSLGGQLNGLDELPSPGRGAHDFPSVLHGAMGHLSPRFFASTESRDILRNFADQRIEKRLVQGVDYDVVTRSVNHGVLLAEVIYSWAGGDGFHKRNERDFSSPSGDHAWVPSEPQQEPLEPHWGTLRPFAIPEADACKPPPPEEFSTDPLSPFYHQAKLVWEATEEATEDQRQLAKFWADAPGETATAPGHWMKIAIQMVDILHLNLADTAELFALVGVAGADSLISSWEEKYHSYLMRPITYIREFIDPHWETIIATPHIPEYTSGHSIVSAASAEVLTELLGEFYFEDRVHEERGLGVRDFDNFHHAARESAISALYGGIHFPMGIDYGLPQGYCVADIVMDRLQTRKDR